MRRLTLGLLPLLIGCSVDNEPGAPHVSPVVVADHSMPAFDGQLSGVDRGEFEGGGLYYRESDGTSRRILDQNVHGIIKNESGIFVFTGLAHMLTNEGYIYAVSRTPSGQIQASLLGRLPGSPAQVEQAANGTTSFLVRTDRFNNSRPVFDCYALDGSIVTRSHDCRTPGDRLSEGK